MIDAWVVLPSLAVFYTGVVVWLPGGEKLPPLWSGWGTAPKMLLVHIFFLGAFLSLIRFLSWDGQSFIWLSRGLAFTRMTVILLFALASLMGCIERVLLSRHNAADRTGGSEDSSR